MHECVMWAWNQDLIFGNLNSRWLVDIQTEISLESEVVQTGDINLGLVSTWMGFTAKKRDEINLG